MSDADAPMTGPFGDPARHVAGDDLARGLDRLRAQGWARDRGAVSLFVSRTSGETRETPARVRLTASAGMPGDKWDRRLPINPDAQLTVMRRDVAELIANGQPLTLFGDNLFVDLDLSAENLPVGTRLTLGSVGLVVTPKPHNGCKKFAARFGLDAMALVAAKGTRPLNLRGIYLRVIDDGEAALGDELCVVERAG